MDVQDVVALHEIVREFNPTTPDLLSRCEHDGVMLTEGELTEHALTAGIGLLDDGQWYTFEQSSMVDESRRHHKVTPQTERLADF